MSRIADDDVLTQPSTDGAAETAETAANADNADALGGNPATDYLLIANLLTALVAALGGDPGSDQGIGWNDATGQLEFGIGGGGGGGTGPRGAQGIPGMAGEDAESAPMMIPGPAGPQGAAGTPGTPGSTGATGAAGPAGIGMSGEDGEDALMIPGPQGIQGIQGVTGPTGAQGAAGMRGLDGDEGEPSMIPGPQGLTGPQGTAGATGAAGSQGVQGIQGMTGDDGEDAIVIPGPQGIQGAAGTPGAAGAAGAFILISAEPDEEGDVPTPPYTPTNVDGWTVLVKPANQDVTNAGVTNDTDFFFTVAANVPYAIDADLIIAGSDATGDFTMDLTVSAGTQKGKGTCQNLTAADAIQNILVVAAAAASTTAIITGTAADVATPIFINIHYAFTPSSAGTMRFRFGNSAASAGRISRVYKGSVFRYKPLS